LRWRFHQISIASAEIHHRVFCNVSGNESVFFKGDNMTPLYVVVSLVFSAFLYEPLWFDTRPHYFYKTYETQAKCKEAKDFAVAVDIGRGSVCTDKNALYLTSSSSSSSK
jgi:hypothetical protein